MPIDFMMLVKSIQHHSINELYDFATIIQDKFHEGLINAKNEIERLEFKNYSLLCHLIFYQNMAYWGNEIRIRVNDPYTCFEWLVQRWTQVWDIGPNLGVIVYSLIILL